MAHEVVIGRGGGEGDAEDEDVAGVGRAAKEEGDEHVGRKEYLGEFGLLGLLGSSGRGSMSGAPDLATSCQRRRGLADGRMREQRGGPECGGYGRWAEERGGRREK